VLTTSLIIDITLNDVHVYVGFLSTCE